MKKFRVHMTELVFYSVIVEAENEDDAEIIAEAAFVAGNYETGGNDDRKITEVEELP